MNITANVAQISGIGIKTAKLLGKLDIYTVEDLLFHLPAYYRDLSTYLPISKTVENIFAVICATVTLPPRWVRRTGKFSMFSFEVADGTGVLDINIFNLPFLFDKYKIGQKLIFFGKIKSFRARPQMDNPDVFSIEKPPGILAYYPLTAGITQKKMRQMIKNALFCVSGTVLPDSDYSTEFCTKYGVQGDVTDFKMLHIPSNNEEPLLARRSMVFKEFLLFNKMICVSGHGRKHRRALEIPDSALAEYLKKLPFLCTQAQQRSMAEVLADLSQPFSANRLIQGDVGSGKTAVAMFAVYATALAGGQCILMAPTELLADQHYAFATGIFGTQAALLKGSTGKREREEISRRVASGEIMLLISTHAILYADLPFKNLQLSIIDEQHRFGVAQRSFLIHEHVDLHTIVMSATPIPRSLAIILYGNADISLLDEMPPGRLPVKTFLVNQNKREDMYNWIFAQAQKGDKAYIICPLLEPSEGVAYSSVTEVHKELFEKYKNVPMEILHGKLPEKTKQSVMNHFREGKTHILISTTVVEVGMDVSDATMMAVENADVFGLAQLHQLRGRVGRGNRESYCYFLSDGSGLERLKILKECSDGFEIARRDLQFRGTGELFGTRQHGEESFRIADILKDEDVFWEAKAAIEHIRQEFPKDDALLTVAASSRIYHQKYLSV